MSEGRRYKDEDSKELNSEEKELQKKYEEMIKEIESKNKSSFNEETVETIQSIDKDIEKEDKKPSIQEIKKEIEALQDKELDTEKEEKLDNTIKETDDKITEELFVVEEDKIDEINENLDIIEEEQIDEMNELEEKMDKNLKNKSKKPKSKIAKSFSILGKIIYYLLFVFILFVLILVVVQRFSGNEISVGGFRMFNILTGSMEPEYKVGDVLISKEIEPKDIKLGDDIVYKGKEKPFVDLIVTHRVVDLNHDNKTGKYSFQTKGIANDIEDPVIEEDQVYGKIIYKVRSFSLLAKSVNNMYIFFFVIFIPIVLLISIKIIQVRHERKLDEED